MLFVADGTAYHMHDRSANRYMKLDLPPRPTQLGGAWGAEIDAFFGGPEAEAGKAILAGEETVDGAGCWVVKVRKNAIDSSVYVIGKADGLIRRAEMTMEETGFKDTATTLLTNIHLNAPLTSADFRFTPPGKAQGMEGADKLLPVGAKAPDFTLRALDGTKVSLSGALKARKAVVLNFWFYH
jgi:hypothetical protein